MGGNGGWREALVAAWEERGLAPGRLRPNICLAPFTTFCLGGPADLYFAAENAEDLALAVTAARQADAPWFLLGVGANVLIGDRGVRGLVIHNRARGLRWLDIEEAEDGSRLLEVESGATMWPDVIEEAVSAGLSGLEHYVGIPSSVGGALWQNLHFLSPERDRTMFIEEVLAGAELLTEDGERRCVDADYFEFGYDDSILHHRRDVVLSATFRLSPAPEASLREILNKNLAWRAKRHPPLATEPSAGSIFQKIEGVGAGRLIDECGLKGLTIGGATVSHRHANIFINRGHATAADLRRLIDYVQEIVAQRTGRDLEVEISLVGEF